MHAQARGAVVCPQLAAQPLYRTPGYAQSQPEAATVTPGSVQTHKGRKDSVEFVVRHPRPLIHYLQVPGSLFPLPKQLHGPLLRGMANGIADQILKHLGQYIQVCLLYTSPSPRDDR